MPVDIAVHPVGNPIYGQLPPAPGVPVLEGQAGLAEDTNSQVLNAPSGATLVLLATAKLRVDIRPEADAASLNAATSGMVIGANERVFFSLAKGNWILKTAVYA